MSILFKNNFQQRDYITAVAKKLYPRYKTSGYYYRQILNKCINEQAVILDAGCGDGGITAEYKGKAGMIIGVDNNKNLLNKNTAVDQKILADLERIPLESNSVDVVVSDFVLEHLVNPGQVFNELARILKPKGVCIVRTPNAYNPIMVASKFLPLVSHKFLRQYILKKNEETHQTVYKANTYRKLLYIARTAGLESGHIYRVGNPEYIGFTKPLVWPALMFERLIDNKLLGVLKMYLVGYFIKS